MKKYNIFLASSAELDSDKEAVELFISRKNKELHKKRIFLELSTWKDFVSAMTEEHSQEMYNHYIETSDIAIFLFHTKFGRYTKEEFETAHRAFQKSSHKIKKPLIYTFFKTSTQDLPDISEFKTYIDGLEHFYDTYDNMEGLFVQLNRQLEKLENEGVLIPEPIDVGQVVKYAPYSILLLLASFLAYYHYQPLQMTVKIYEPQPIPNLSFQKADLSLTYGDKTDQLEIETEAIFKQIPSKFKGSQLVLHFSAKGYQTIDTLVNAGEFVALPIWRDSSLAYIFGSVKDEENRPLENVQISVKNLKITTDQFGKYHIIIPFHLQALEQRLSAYKEGYQLWDETFPIVAGVDVPIILKK